MTIIVKIPFLLSSLFCFSDGLTISAADIKDADVKELLANVLNRLNEKDEVIQTLENKVWKLEETVQKQSIELSELRNELKVKDGRLMDLQDLIGTLGRQYSPAEKVLNDDDDITPQAETKLPNSEVERPKQTRQIENENPIAFFATVADHLLHDAAHQYVRFDNVVTNLGNAYNPHLGGFVAPVDGIYVFSVTLTSFVDTHGHYEYTLNSQLVSRLYLEGTNGGGTYYSTSQTIILQLAKGDTVAIRHYDADKSVNGNHYSSFAGFLLQQLYGSPGAILGRGVPLVVRN